MPHKNKFWSVKLAVVVGWSTLAGTVLAQISFDASSTTGGAIRPGFTSTCNSASLGAIRTNVGVPERCDGSSWAALGGSTGAPDRIVSTSANVVTGNGGTISFTTGGVSGTAFFDTVGRLVTPGISTTTNRSSFTTIYASGNVGIGTSAPVAALNVSGSVVSNVYNAGSATTFDWSFGNVQYTSASCGAFTFSNMQDGGSYSLIVTGGTSGTCSFSHTGLTFYLPSGYGATTASTRTVFSFLRAGTAVYVTQVRGLV